MVPRFCSSSAAVMPMPLSEMVSVLAIGSALMRILSSSPDASSGRVSASKRRLSSASEAFETSSRKNTSLLLYSELTTKCRTWLTSALKEWVVVASLIFGVSPGITRSKLDTLPGLSTRREQAPLRSPKTGREPVLSASRRRSRIGQGNELDVVARHLRKAARAPFGLGLLDAFA